MEYLKDEQYYFDLYDLHTIEICIEWAKSAIDHCNKDKEYQKFPKNEQIRAKNILVEMPMYYKKGERYRDREKTINEWQQRDRAKQEKYDNAKEPDGIFCPKCNWAMELTAKELLDYNDEPLKILFFFECPKCQKRRGIYDDGSEYVSKPRLCPKCNDNLKISYESKGNISIFTEKCVSCKYELIDKTNYKEYEDKQKKLKERQVALLAKFRKECCMSKEDGDKYVSQQTQTLSLMRQKDEETAKKSDPRYQKAMSLKKLKVNELQKVIQDVTTSCGFENLNFEKPEIDKYVIISFNVQETKSDRSDYDACQTLRRSLTKALKTTNWRLMSEGIGCRLGLLYGRVKGYESEDELAKIV